MPDEILDMTQRLGKLSVEDALFLVLWAADVCIEGFVNNSCHGQRRHCR